MTLLRHIARPSVPSEGKTFSPTEAANSAG